MIWLLLIPVVVYFFFFLEIYRNLRKIEPFREDGITGIFLSVVIACKDEENNLPQLLKCLLSQDYNPEHFEVIVVDDNSGDSTYTLASSFSKIRNLRVLHNPGTGKKSAIGVGVKAASGELIITTDADCCPPAGWLSAISCFYGKLKADMIIAPVQLVDKPGFMGRFMELEFLSLQGITAGTTEAGMPIMCNGANLAFTKEAYNRHSENLRNEVLSGDDIFLLHSLKKEPQSKIVWLDSVNAIVNTGQPDSLKSYFKQRSRWISKAKTYDDQFTIFISIVTFVTIFTSVILLFGGIWDKKILLLFLLSFIIKSIPDFLILRNTTNRYSKGYLMKWFLLSQLVYPFYVLIVAGFSVFLGGRWK